MTTLPADFTPSPDTLAGRVILITGATGGLGSAMAACCAGAGATVVLCGRSIPKLEALYDRIVSSGGAEPAILPVNLLGATWVELEKIVDSVGETLGRLDALVHCAAHFRAFTRLEDLEPREWMDSLQVNLTASYTLTRLCLPLLRRSPDASVLWISDASGRQAQPFHGIYGICKAACETMSSTWALELENESNLRFNTVHPGPMRSALRARGYMAETLANLPSPEQIAPRLSWLLGQDSHGISGRAFSIEESHPGILP